MVDEAFGSKVVRLLDASHFTTEPLGWIFGVQARYWQEYAVRCTDVPLRNALKYARTEQVPRYSAEVEAVIALGAVPEAGYIKSELREYARRAVFAEAHQESAKLFNEGKHAEAYDLMAKAQDRIRAIDFEDVDRQWYFEEFVEREAQRRSVAALGFRAFGTGLKELDEATDGGVHPGELWVVEAYAKRGKTTFLINQGYRATYVHREPTLHLILEGQGKKIAARYDACMSDDLYARVKSGALSTQSYRVLQEEFVRLRGLLVIRTINDWDVNILHVQNELRELRARGFMPTMLIVDYMDLLRARTRADSETEHQLQAARDLKRLVNQEDLACWSAWQAQRPKPGAHLKKHILTSSHAADCYAKVRIVDAYGSLNATDEELRLGQMRIYWEGHRDAPVGLLWRVQNDLSRMRMVVSSERIEFKEEE